MLRLISMLWNCQHRLVAQYCSAISVLKSNTLIMDPCYIFTQLLSKADKSKYRDTLSNIFSAPYAQKWSLMWASTLTFKWLHFGPSQGVAMTRNFVIQNTRIQKTLEIRERRLIAKRSWHYFLKTCRIDKNLASLVLRRNPEVRGIQYLPYLLSSVFKGRSYLF